MRNRDMNSRLDFNISAKRDSDLSPYVTAVYLINNIDPILSVFLQKMPIIKQLNEYLANNPFRQRKLKNIEDRILLPFNFHSRDWAKSAMTP
ncbi:hypothetical protein NPIL_702321 [Nephila pilipes]|uniref:Uncharacterized protein n=1 Tax=Nephila pilipes TaxID=299642 RepID=A0A8X6N4G8_NEPPI|nr:hypothetical protein NPIL_702321 [Nephila pilipes]